MTYVPYSQLAPQTTNVQALREELRRVIRVYGRGTSYAKEAFDRLNAASHLAGQPLNGLRKHTANETERFFAFTILGPDGHTYWDGPQAFVRNDGSTRRPRLWWWDRSGGAELRAGDSVVATCGEANCITPEHCEKQSRTATHRLYTDEQMIGALQVTALRLGRVPGKAEWERLGLTPTTTSLYKRFGNSWERVCRAAGLTAPVQEHPDKYSADDCVRSLQAARAILGRWPSSYDYCRPGPLRDALKVDGYPTDYKTVCRHLGSWPAALRKAGMP